MADLKDSGARRNFETGAVRDIAEGKGRCDLLPLHQVAAILDDEIIRSIGDYEESGNTSSLQKAIGLFSDMVFGSRYTAMLEAAKQYEDGCQKYGERNWQKGIPVHCYIDSGVRHYLKFRRGDVDEPHDRAFIWNMLGAIWTHENKPELIDLPFAAAGNPATPITTEDKPVEPWGEEDEIRAARICTGESCSDCPIPNLCKQNSGGLGCGDWCKAHPAEARKIMDKWEGRNHA